MYLFWTLMSIFAKNQCERIVENRLQKVDAIILVLSLFNKYIPFQYQLQEAAREFAVKAL